MSSHSGRSLNGNEWPAFLILSWSQQLSQTAVPSPGVCRERLGQHSSEGLGPVSMGSQGTFPLSAVPCLYHTIDCNTESAPCDFLVLTSLRRVTFKLSHLPLLVFEILSFPHSQNVIYFLTSTLYEYYLGKSDLKRNRVLFCCFFPLKYIT